MIYIVAIIHLVFLFTTWCFFRISSIVDKKIDMDNYISSKKI